MNNVAAMTGQNAVQQTKLFKEVAGVTAMRPKLDDTGNGGVVVAIKNEQDVPLKFVGVGERTDDLESHAFAAALFAVR